MIRKEKILIVDDVEINREILNLLLTDKYEIIEAADGEDALEIIENEEDKLVAVLLDLDLPRKNGYEVLKMLKEKNLAKYIPVIIITAENSANAEDRCLELGAFDFIKKPFSRILVEKRVGNAVELFSAKKSLEHQVKQKTEELKNALRKQQELSGKLKQENEAIIDMLGAVVESRSVESGAHIQRVKDYTRILGEHYLKFYPESQLTAKRLETIVAASPLHDIGKIAVPDSILLKPGKLTAEEFEEMKSHTTKGGELLNSIRGIWNSEDPEYEKIVHEICVYHHEKYDGKGYPKGLVGDQIPLCAQLVSLADYMTL